VWSITEDEVIDITERGGFTTSNLAQPLDLSSAHHILREIRERLGNKTCKQLSKLLNIYTRYNTCQFLVNHVTSVPE
jgi:hypothetical protein